ncbi:MAG: excinuclease ABC subunit UvrA, partial [Polyangiales bacterium]
MISTSLRGARTHNLQGVDLDLRSGELTVLAGPSGAGKSSLARHTLHAEGQRRYVESFSAYARQFLERLPRPPLASLEPVPVSVAVDRQAPVRTSRSTVGTLTEINDYLKDLWAHAATLMCPGCDVPVQRLDSHQWAARLIDKHRGDRLVVTFALPLGPPGSAKQAQNEAEQGQRYLALRDALTHEGYGRVVLDAGMQQLDQVAPSQVLASCRAEGWLPVVLDRLEAAAGMEARLSAALDAAFARGQGMAVLWRLNAARQLEPCGRIFQGLVCSACGARFQPPTPGLFSFNSAAGACPTCRGFGRVMAIDMDKVIPDPTLSLAAGAIRPWQGSGTQWERKALARHGRRAGVPLDVPVGALTPAQRRWLIEGESAATSAEGELEAQEQDGCWWGIRGWFRWLEGRTYKMHVRVLLSRYRRYDTCPDCQGTRLRPEALQWRMAGLRLPDFWQLSAAEAVDWLQARQAEWQAEGPAGRLLQQCLRRLKTLVEVGLPYLSLAREARTLSGGEAQRVALTSALGAELSDALFVLDEPTVGLHPRDTARLLGAVRGLCQDGNTVLVVEHDPEVLRAADRVVELGPGSGAAGGRIVYDGTPAQLAQADTATAAALRQTVTASHQPCGRAEPWLTLKGARGHNLQGVDLRLPLGRLTAITGVSGSGKSSLLRATLVPRLQQHCGQTPDRPALPHDGLSGAEPIRKVVEVDQSPLSRTPRANAATFTKAWDIVRQRFAAEPLAMQRAYTASTFSFNTEGGRCEACKGQGFETVEMQFLADITFSCASCQGRRFREEVLEVRHRGWNVAEVLTASVDEALQRFAADAALCKRLQPLREVGLGHLPLGQPLSQLSGGEAQRLKLAEALGACSEPSLLVLDEPSAGLHHVDVQPLMAALRRLVAAGHTVVLIEHDMHLAAQADHLIEMGPDAGDAGGHIVQTGTPRQVAQRDCLSAPYLRAALGTASMPQGPGQDACADHDVDLDAPVLAKAAAGMIRLRGATEHNLKGVDLDVPRGKLVAFTGPSGSGKSSLVFDVLYSEAQRRYFETLSPYARQYMAQLPRAHVEHIRGLPPAVALSQRQSVGGQQSTVATMTEVAQHLRLLFARVGTLHCPDCDLPVARGERTQLLQHAGAHFDKRRQVQVYAPLVRQRKGHYRELLARLHEAGIAAVRVDGTHQPLTAGMQLARHKLHDIDAFLGAARVGDAAFAALLDAALARGDGQVQLAQDERQLTGSLRRACPGCARVFPELDPRLFSFNTTLGACSACAGCGVVDAAKTRGARSRRAAPARTCSACGGSRLSTLARCVRVGARNIADVLALDIDAAAAELATWSASGPEGVVIRTLVDACLQRLSLLLALGLGYLALDRSAASLSGGEAQRVRLAAQLGSGLSPALSLLLLLLL